MEPNALTETALALFGLAAGNSLLMAVLRLGGVAQLPEWLDTSLVALAAAGIALLGITAVTIGISPMVQIAMAMFFLAATSGVAMQVLFRRKRLPIRLMVFRAFLAGIAFVLLVVGTFGQDYINKLPVPTMIHNG